jgi:effector-binding domain-containing protein
MALFKTSSARNLGGLMRCRLVGTVFAVFLQVSSLAFVLPAQVAFAQQMPPPGSLAAPPSAPNPLAPGQGTGGSGGPQPQQDAQPPGTTPSQGADQVRPTEMGGPIDLLLEAKPMLSLKGQSTWDDGFESLSEAMQRVEAEAKRLALKTTSKSKTAFLSTDDFGFRYEAFIEFERGPNDPAPALDKDFQLGQSPAGRALKFTHTGPYDDIDTTYEAITAYLDEKGAKARNLFVEEYVKTPKSSEDPALEMNIFILVE